MTTAFRLRQVWIIARLEMRRAFFSKRAIWVYLLALFPSVIFIGNGIDVIIKRNRWKAGGITPAAVLDSVRKGDVAELVLARTGKPFEDRTWTSGREWRTVETRGPGGQRNYRRERGQAPPIRWRYMGFFDGTRRFDLTFKNGLLDSQRSRPLANLENDRSVFAGVFQFFYLRLGIFFGCLGIFMNLFRGEMLDKTLHFWLLAPVRREVLLCGKYLAGLVAASVIFTFGALLCFAAMLWPQDPAQVQMYLRDQALTHALWYSASALLACVGYGSFFVASGLLVRNPIIPAAVLLLWENVAGFLPSMLQKLSVLHYVQALCPVPVPTDPDMPAFVRLFFAPAAPPSAPVAIAGVLALTALVLWLAARVIRKIEINYSTE
jgi:ABC-type transport system involved in multi-copper enzyme maturation permease subunit